MVTLSEDDALTIWQRHAASSEQLAFVLLPIGVARSPVDGPNTLTLRLAEEGRRTHLGPSPYMVETFYQCVDTATPRRSACVTILRLQMANRQSWLPLTFAVVSITNVRSCCFDTSRRCSRRGHFVDGDDMDDEITLAAPTPTAKRAAPFPTATPAMPWHLAWRFASATFRGR